MSHTSDKVIEIFTLNQKFLILSSKNFILGFLFFVRADLSISQLVLKGEDFSIIFLLGFSEFLSEILALRVSLVILILFSNFLKFLNKIEVGICELMNFVLIISNDCLVLDFILS